MARVVAMSSSKVFKQDPHFTPTTLVRRNITPAPSRPLTRDGVSTASSLEPSKLAEQPEIPTGLETAAQVAPETQPVVDLEAVRQEAYNQGMADLAAQYQYEVQQVVATFADACQKIDNHRILLLRHSQAELINLIMQLCEKVVRQELSTPRNLIAATLQSALEQAVASEEYHVTVHPDDLAVTEQQAPELIAAIRGIERIVFKTDETMTRGGCLLESASCSVDATIETQLASLKEFVTEHAMIPPLPGEEEVSSTTSSFEETAPKA